MITIPYPPIVEEEIARRARIQYLRNKIKPLVQNRRLIKAAYRLPHGSPEHLQRLVELRSLLGYKEYSYAAHCQPGRHDYKSELTCYHMELAGLRGKVHYIVRDLDSSA